MYTPIVSIGSLFVCKIVKGRSQNATRWPPRRIKSIAQPEYSILTVIWFILDQSHPVSCALDFVLRWTYFRSGSLIISFLIKATLIKIIHIRSHEVLALLLPIFWLIAMLIIIGGNINLLRITITLITIVMAIAIITLEAFVAMAVVVLVVTSLVETFQGAH